MDSDLFQNHVCTPVPVYWHHIPDDKVQKSLLGFASGVMVAASVWSLLIPSLDMASGMGRLSFIPACVGFMLGILFLLGMDMLVPHLQKIEKERFFNVLYGRLHPIYESAMTQGYDIWKNCLI